MTADEVRERVRAIIDRVVAREAQQALLLDPIRKTQRWNNNNAMFVHPRRNTECR